MQRVICDMSQVHDDVLEIVPLADIHLGDPEAQMSIITNEIEKIKSKPNRYCILAGDLMNTAIKTSISDTYSETLTPQQQLDKCIELFEPIKDKILCIVTGNHEERISKLAGVNMVRMFAMQLGLEDVYSDTSAVCFVKFGQNRRHKNRSIIYSIYVNHGSGGGRKAGGKINRLEDYSRIICCDVYVVGHTHFPATFKGCTYVTNNGNMTLSKIEQTFVNTASSLAYGGYGDRQGYVPASNAYPVIQLDSKEKKVSVCL